MESQSKEAEMTSTAFFDEETLLWRMGGNIDDAKALLEAFSMESQCFIEEIRLDIERHDAYALRTDAEKLHECASAISSATVKYFAHKMASAAEQYDFDAAARLLPTLVASLQMLNKKLRAAGWLA